MPSAREKPAARRPGRKMIVIAGLVGLSILTGVVVVLSFAGRTPPPTVQAPPAMPRADREQQLAGDVTLRARALLAQHELPKAIELMAAFVDAYPTDFRVRPLLADAYLQAGQMDKAERTADRVLIRDPLHRQASWVKGQAMQARGAQGFQNFWARAAADPSEPDVLIKVGCAFLAAGQLDQAQNCLDRGMRSLPNRPDGLAGIARLKMIHGDLPGSLADYERVVTLLDNRISGDTAMGLSEVNSRLAALDSDIDSKTRRYKEAARWAWRATAFPETRLEGNFKAAQVYYILGGDENTLRAAELIASASELAPADRRVIELHQKIAAAMPATRPASQPAQSFVLDRSDLEKIAPIREKPTWPAAK